MTNRDYLRLAPQKAIDAALSIDAAGMSSQRELFKLNNAVTYDLAINSWLLAIRDYAPYSWTSIATRIQRTGLASTVAYFGDAAAAFIREELLSEFPLANNLLTEITMHFQHRSLITSNYASSQTIEGVFLFLCRYLKRFTPLHADKLDEKAVSDFVSNQNRLKLLCRNGYNAFILDCVRSEVDTSLINRRTRSWSSIKMADIEITPGTCYSLDGKKCSSLSEKINSLIREYNYDSLDVWRSSVWGYQLGNLARLSTVPKSFSSARTIAPEECLRQAIAHRMFTLRQEELPGIDLTNQSVNQRFALEGSITGEWCTIDLSHASDDVTWVLVQDIYKDTPLYLQYLSRIRPSYIQVNKKERLLQSFATMGNSMTFLVESEVFWLITKAAVHFAQRCGIECDDTVITYGDDIICASEAYPFVEAFLTKLGFLVNNKKSFYNGSFRESCGKDYFNGNDVSSPYFPRKPLKTLLEWYRNKNSELITVAESLISLQHRLYEVSPISSQYIELYIREHKPNLGIEPVGTQSTDLWGLDVVPYRTRYYPQFERIEQEPETRWVFREGSWRYSTREYRYVKCPIQDELHMRTYQLRPVVHVEKVVLPDSILYNQYLYYGPMYASFLDASLGISTSRRSLPAGKPTSAWEMIER